MTRVNNRNRRRRIIERDGTDCYLCGVECVPATSGVQAPNALTIDHVIPIAYGGTNDEDNLRVCCRACNVGKDDAVPEHMWWRLMWSLARWEFQVPAARWI